MNMVQVRGHVEFKADAYEMHRGFKAEARKALEVLGKIWHSRYLPIHFTEAAYTRYGFHKRTWKYVKRKRRTLGHNRPNVFSGETQRQVMQPPQITSSINSEGRYRTRVKMKYPDYIHYRKGGQGRREITAHHESEDKSLAVIMQGRLKERMQRRNTRAQKRVKRIV